MKNKQVIYMHHEESTDECGKAAARTLHGDTHFLSYLRYRVSNLIVHFMIHINSVYHWIYFGGGVELAKVGMATVAAASSHITLDLLPMLTFTIYVLFRLFMCFVPFWLSS